MKIYGKNVIIDITGAEFQKERIKSCLYILEYC